MLIIRFPLIFTKVRNSEENLINIILSNLLPSLYTFGESSSINLGGGATCLTVRRVVWWITQLVLNNNK